MKKGIALLTALALLLSASGCGQTEAAAQESKKTAANSPEKTVTDLLGRTVEAPENASSFACIGAGALRLYCYVADEDRLAGVESAEQTWGTAGRPYAMALEGLEDMTAIGPGGPGAQPDAELLLAASPDVIFTCYNADVSAVDELQASTGIPVVALSYGSGSLFDEAVDESLLLIGSVTGCEERASAVVSYFAAEKEALCERASEAAHTPTVYLGGLSYQGAHGIDSTTGDYVIFDVLSAENAAAEAGLTGTATIDREALLNWNPEVIVLDAGGLSIIAEDYAGNPAYYNALDAFQNGKVYLQMPFNYYAANLEIALADAWYLGSVLYPEQFADVDPAAKFDEITQFLLGIDAYESIAAQYYGGFQAVSLGNTEGE